MFNIVNIVLYDLGRGNEKFHYILFSIVIFISYILFFTCTNKSNSNAETPGRTNHSAGQGDNGCISIPSVACTIPSLEFP